MTVHTTQTLHEEAEARIKAALRVVKYRGGERVIIKRGWRSQPVEYRSAIRNLEQAAALLRMYSEDIFDAT